MLVLVTHARHNPHESQGSTGASLCQHSSFNCWITRPENLYFECMIYAPLLTMFFNMILWSHCWLGISPCSRKVQPHLDSHVKVWGENYSLCSKQVVDTIGTDFCDHICQLLTCMTTACKFDIFFRRKDSPYSS